MNEPVYPKTGAILDIWRVGLMAYREAAKQELHISHCHSAAAAAICAAYPHLTEREARRHSIQAVAWASVHHHAWLWNGVPRREWIWPPDKRGVGVRRNPGYENT